MTAPEQAGRRMPQPGQRWRLRFRLGGEYGDKPCGCVAPPEGRKALIDRCDGKVYLVVPGDSVGSCGWCGQTWPRQEGMVAILTGALPGYWAYEGITVPYTWLEPEDWRAE